MQLVGIDQIDHGTPAGFFGQLVGEHGDGQLGRGGAVIVLVVGDLIVAQAPLADPGGQLAELMDVLQLDDAQLDRLELDEKTAARFLSRNAVEVFGLA